MSIDSIINIHLGYTITFTVYGYNEILWVEKTSCEQWTENRFGVTYNVTEIIMPEGTTLLNHCLNYSKHTMEIQIQFDVYKTSIQYSMVCYGYTTSPGSNSLSSLSY